MVSAPLISVVIPSYNHRAYIGSAIRSVFAQDYGSIELVVVDDGSSDDSTDFVRELLKQSPLAKATLIEQENQGAHAAIAHGLEAAEGSILAILNSDDFYLPARLGRLAAALADRNRGLAFSALRCVDDAGCLRPSDDPWSRWYSEAVADRATCPTTGFALLLNNFSVTSSNFVFQRALYDQLGGFSAHKFCHDWDFLMRATLVAEPLFLEDDLLRYRIHESNSTMGLRGVQVREVADVLNRYLRLALNKPTTNPLAPTPKNWPHLFPKFVTERRFHFGSHPIGYYIDPLLRIELFAQAARQVAA